MIWAAILLAFAEKLPPSPLAKPPLEMIDSPEWIRRPTGEDIARLYPEKAVRQRVTGRASLFCAVNPQGSLFDCKVVEAFPADFGFDQAVLKMAPLFRMRLPTKDGVPMQGTTVRIPIRFLLPGTTGTDALSLVLGCYGQTATASEADPANQEHIAAYTFFATQVALREREARATPQSFELNLADARRGATTTGPEGGPGTPSLKQCVDAFQRAQKPG